MTVKAGEVTGIEPLEDVIERTGLGKRRIPNAGDSDAAADALEQHLSMVIGRAKEWMSQRRKEFEAGINAKLNAQLEALEALRKRQLEHVGKQLANNGLPGATSEERMEAERRRIDRTFDEFIEWVEDTMTTDDNPYLQLVAVLQGQS